MKKIFTLLCVLAVFLVFSMVNENEKTIIIYSSMEQYRGAELQKQLNEVFPEDKVLVMYMSTAKSAAKIKTEKENSDADIIVGLETSYMEKIKDSLADIKGISKQEYVDGLKVEDNENVYVTWERQAGTFIINNDVIKKRGLDVPKTYEDLLDPQYKGLIAMPDPKTSGTGYFFYKSLVNQMGEEKALDYFEKLHKNVKLFTESGSGPIKLLVQGEVAVGLGLTFQAIEEINEGSPFRIVYPKEGSPYSLTGTAMLKGREKDEKIKAIFDYIVNDFFVYDKEYFSPEQVLMSQQNKIKNYPENIHYANMEGIDDINEKERLLKLWKY